jgi:Tryptophan-rich sensory protein (mitochondrial benzodiazepine receptor homolog)
MKRIGYFLGPILIGFLVGYFAGMVQSEAIANWYPSLKKPSLTPPNSLFPVAWGIIYILSGISLGFILRTVNMRKSTLVALFAIQLFLNFLWCLVFFGMKNPAGGMVIIVLLLIDLLTYAAFAWCVNKWSTWLFAPYILWVCFATYLNAYIWMYN